MLNSKKKVRMKPKPQEKTQKATCHPTQPHWHQMNRKQRLETIWLHFGILG
jgi:hypothetical protein